MSCVYSQLQSSLSDEAEIGNRVGTSVPNGGMAHEVLGHEL